MRSNIKSHLDKVLSHLYINPLERCNLRCKICYTRKTAPILTEKEILEFVDRYKKAHRLETITFCGGEVFTLPYFPKLVNKLVGEGIFVQIITNGTIDKLTEFENSNMVNLIVSLDGLRSYHDKNRGGGNFDRSMRFLEKAQKLGFHTEIFSIVTRQNIDQIEEFEKYLFDSLYSEGPVPKQSFGFSGQALKLIPRLPRKLRSNFTGRHPGIGSAILPVTYHPRKPPAYLLHHPISNIFGETDGFGFLGDAEMVTIMKEKKTFPPKNLGCYQIALVSDGKVYGCCEGTVPIGKIDDDIEFLFDKLKDRIEVWEKTNTLKNCLGCSQSDFMCGIKKYLNQI